MPLDLHNLSRFVSSEVRERCREGNIAKSELAANTTLIMKRAMQQSIDSMGSKSISDFERMPQSPEVLEELQDIAESAIQDSEGVVAIIEIAGYTDLIARLAQRKFSAQVVERSIEMMDLIAQNGGDVIKFLNDSIVCVWRLKSSNLNEPMHGGQYLERKIELCVIAILTCVACRDMLEQSEVWALEGEGGLDGFKLKCTAGVGYGGIHDIHIGAKPFSMTHFIMGAAYEDAHDSFSNMKGISCSRSAWNLARTVLNDIGMTAGTEDDQGPLTMFTKELLDRGTNKKLSECSQMNIEWLDNSGDYSNASIENFVPEVALVLLKANQEKKVAMFNTGAWVECVVLSISVHLLDTKGAIAGMTRDYQKYYEMILKAAKRYGLFVLKVFVTKGKEMVVQCLAAGPTNENSEYQVAAIKMALNCIHVLVGGFHTKHVCVAICSGTCYEGILQASTRSAHRLVGECVMRSSVMATKCPFTGIISDKNTFEACKGLPVSGLFQLYVAADERDFTGRSTTGLYNLTRIEDRRRFSIVGHRKSINNGFEDEFLPEHIKVLQTAAKNTTNGEHQNIVIGGPQGSGKTIILKKVEKLLIRMDFIVCSAECREHEAFNHPLFPFVSLIPQIMDAVDKHVLFSGANKPLEVKKMREAPSQLLSTEDRANKLLERASSNIKMKRKSRSNREGKDKPSPTAPMWSKYKAKILVNGNAKVHPTPRKGSILGYQSHDTKKLPITVDTRETISRLKDILIKAGEDINETLPLLNPFYAPTISDSAETEKIGADGRTVLLASLVVRLLDKISESKAIAIVVDDLQWMDSASWAITLNIIRRCKNALVVLTSSPCADWRFKILTQISARDDTHTIELHGSTSNDLSGILHQQFDIWAEHVDKRVVEVIKRKSEGRISHVANLVAYLKDTNYLKVQNNTLVSAVEMSVFEGCMHEDFEQLLLWNFDHIPSQEFQHFIKCAAVVGRSFSLEEVGSIMMERDSISQSSLIARMSSLLKIFDFHGMIEVKDVGSKRAPNYPFKVEYSFVNSELREIIYHHRLTTEEVESSHLKLLRYYEKKINDENEPTFLPLICFHGRRAGLKDRDAIIQHVQYSIMLGNFLCISCEAYKEMLTLYIHIQELVESHNLEEIVGRNVVTEIHIRLGHAYSHGFPDEINRIQSLRHLMIATQLLEFKWPRTDTEWYGLLSFEIGFLAISNVAKLFLSKAIQKDKKQLMWKKYLYPVLGRDDFSKNKNIDRLEQLQPILENMSKNLFESDAPMTEQLGCDILVLNNSFRLGNYNSSSSRLLMSIAIKAWFNGNLMLAMSFADRCAGKDIDAQGYASGSFFWTSSGRWKIASEWVENGIALSLKRGEFTNWLSCTKEQSFIYLWEGDFRLVLETELDRAIKSKMNGNTNGVITAETTAICIQLLKGDYEEATAKKIHMQHSYREVGPALRAQFQAIFAHMEAANDNLVQALDCVERLVELMPKIHYTNNSIFVSVLLGVLAIRNVYEKFKARGFKMKGDVEGSKARRESKQSSNASIESLFPTSKSIIGLVDLAGKPMFSNNLAPTTEEEEEDETRMPAATAVLPSSNSVKKLPSDESRAQSPTSGLRHSKSLKKLVSLSNSGISIGDLPKMPTKLDQTKLDNIPQKHSSINDVNQSRRVSKAVSDDSPSQKKRSTKDKQEFIIRSQRSEAGDIVFTYKPKQKGAVSPQAFLGIKVLPVQTSAPELLIQIKRLCQNLITQLIPFQYHILAEPLVILLKAMIKSYDPNAQNSQSSDGPATIRLWVQKRVKLQKGEMKLLVALLAISCWKLSGESLDYTADLNVGMSMLAEMGLDSELIF